MRWHPTTDYRSFYFLNATQFLGALNDNIFKLLVIYLLINVQGPSASGKILSIAGAVFVIPFLVFSSSAGVLADRLSKRTIIVYTKILEIFIMLFGLLAVYLESAIGAYTALFFMATQSSIFGPSKYGVIPELVESKMVSKANGSMTSFTYLAIILGTFLASFITDITDKNFVLVATFCVFIALAGFSASLGIKRTAPQNSSKKINPFFIYEVYQTLKMAWKIPHLIPAIFGSSFFLFIGAYTQLNIIPFAIESLHLSEVGGGYLFLATAVGIALGAVLAGQISKDKVELGISCVTGFFISFFFFTLYLFSWSLTATIISLACLGVFGGAFLIPFESFIQVSSADEKRGQVIAATNFLSFTGVLAAAFFIFFISEELQFSAASGFAFMGILSLIMNVLVAGRLSELSIPFFVNKILKRIRRIALASQVPAPHQIVVFESNSWWDPLLLFSIFPKLKILVPGHYFKQFPWINWWIDSIRIIPTDLDSRSSLEKLIKNFKEYQEKGNSICLYFHKRTDTKEILEKYQKIFSRLGYQIVYAHGKKERTPKRFIFFRYYLKKITMHFSTDRQPYAS